ncbi:SUMF1/EgtB/PvdO family nonheme iron enzyme [Carboxylicivirga sp. M1479]|uniref:formylglycine-generating enzyme family protein n=1 Tax=Carboxylicivirga sp. M1479 TaxID=2594476 RepID=UPI00163DD751|nr:SUMF1/EgtB/PvdO family nonheme iron enzyme [Carboxylicivirga sp. M1479]
MEMKKMNLIVFSLMALLVFSASKPKKNKKEDRFKEVSHRFYAGTYEVTNKEFREYLEYLKATDRLAEYNSSYPDTTQWMKKFPHSFNGPFVEKYFWHPGFNNYPVVNVSLEAAKAYCAWLSDSYNSKEKRKYKKVTFRLATEQEWNKMAAVLPGHNLPWYGNFAYEPGSSCSNTNIKFENKVSGDNKYDYSSDGGMTTCVVGSYKANKMGVYDIIGNVAELTESGIIKGGSWDNTIDECVVNKSQDFQLPDPRVGFRVVMLIDEL